jgi:hypothetical protein
MSGFEPLNKGFADLSLSHLGTSPKILFFMRPGADSPASGRLQTSPVVPSQDGSTSPKILFFMRPGADSPASGRLQTSPVVPSQDGSTSPKILFFMRPGADSPASGRLQTSPVVPSQDGSTSPKILFFMRPGADSPASGRLQTSPLATWVHRRKFYFLCDLERIRLPQAGCRPLLSPVAGREYIAENSIFCATWSGFACLRQVADLSLSPVPGREYIAENSIFYATWSGFACLRQVADLSLSPVAGREYIAENSIFCATWSGFACLRQVADLSRSPVPGREYIAEFCQKKKTYLKKNHRYAWANCQIFAYCGSSRARNGTRTRDPNLGKVVLYQLSYSRIFRFSWLGFPNLGPVTSGCSAN